MAWSLCEKKKQFEFTHKNGVNDIVVGREGTPLAERIVSISWDTCRISNSVTGAEVKIINFDNGCNSIAVDNTQTVIAIGTAENVTFIETTNFTKVKEVSMDSSIKSLAFNKGNDCILAVTSKGEVYSFKL